MQDQTGQKARLNYLSADQLAEQLQQTKKWVLRYTRDGTIPAIKIGRQYFYTADAVEAAFEALS